MRPRLTGRDQTFSISHEPLRFALDECGVQPWKRMQLRWRFVASDSCWMSFVFEVDAY